MDADPVAVGRSVPAPARAENLRIADVATPDRRDPLGRHWLRWSVQAAMAGTIVLLWLILVPVLDVPAYLWPPLPAVVDAFRLTFVTIPSEQGLMTPGGGIYDLTQTLTATLVGYGIGTVVALVLAVLATEFRVLDFILQPFISALQALPKIALAPLFLVWFGLGMQGHIALVVSVVVFPIMLNAYAGLRFVPEDYLELARTLRTGRLRTLVLVKLPASLPSLFTGLSIGIIYALLSAIVAEFLVGQDGLGAQLVKDQANGDTAGVFAVLVVLGVLGAGLNGIVSLIGKRAVFWAGKR